VGRIARHGDAVIGDPEGNHFGQKESEMDWKAGTIGVLGLWLALTGFLGFTPQGNLWDALIVGTIVAIVGFVGLLIKGDKRWQGWLSGLLGLWMIFAAFVPDLVAGSGLMWNNLLVGFLIASAGFAALGAGEEGGKSSAHMHEPEHSDCH
jgi:hypothetical protein